MQIDDFQSLYSKRGQGLCITCLEGLEHESRRFSRRSESGGTSCLSRDVASCLVSRLRLRRLGFRGSRTSASAAPTAASLIRVYEYIYNPLHIDRPIDGLPDLAPDRRGQACWDLGHECACVGGRKNGEADI